MPPTVPHRFQASEQASRPNSAAGALSACTDVNPLTQPPLDHSCRVIWSLALNGGFTLDVTTRRC